MLWEVHKSKLANSKLTRPPLIILHGLLSSPHDWSPVAELLATILECVVWVPWMRNHHPTDNSEKEMKFDELWEDVLNGWNQYCQELHYNGPVNMIGHSVGGLTAMFGAFTSSTALKINRLVIVDISPRPYDSFDGLEEVLFAIKATNEADCKSHDKVEQHLCKIGMPPAIASVFKWKSVNRGAKHVFTFPTEIFRKTPTNTKVPEFNSEKSTATIPTVFIRGTQSPFINDDDVNNVIPKKFTNFRVESVDCGHFVPFEKPLKFVELVYLHLFPAKIF